MNKKIEFDFGTFEVDQNIVTGVMKEGSHFDIEENRQLLDFLDSNFINQKYGYISHRINEYSINPTIYIESGSKRNLGAIAIVTDSKLSSGNFLVERQFFTQPFERFETIKEAKEWLSEILSQ